MQEYIYFLLLLKKLKMVFMFHVCKLFSYWSSWVCVLDHIWWCRWHFLPFEDTIFIYSLEYFEFLLNAHFWIIRVNIFLFLIYLSLNFDVCNMCFVNRSLFFAVMAKLDHQPKHFVTSFHQNIWGYEFFWKRFC